MAVTNQMTNNIKPFDGNGFSNWKFRIELCLEQNGVLEMLSKDLPSDTVALETFKKNDIKARCIITQCLADNVLETVKSKKTAKEIMESLKVTYSKTGLATQVQLQRKMRTMKYTGACPLSNFILEYEQIISELKNAGGKIENNEIVTQLLSAMPESYQAVTTAIDVLFCQEGSTMTLDFIKNKLLQEEDRQNKNIENNVENVAFASRKSWRFQKSYKKNTGKVSNDYDKGNITKFPYNCYGCGKKGHKRSECPNRKSGNSANCMYDHKNEPNCSCEVTKEQEISFLANTMETADENQGTVNGEQTKIVSPSSLMVSTKGTELTFIIDSGSTNHLVNSLSGKFLMNTRNVEFPINVAKKGEIIKAQRCGTLFVESEAGVPIKIDNVLECKDLAYNLLSVRKIEEQGFQVLFKNGKVTIIKDTETVAEGKLHGNLYTLVMKPKTFCANISEDMDLWHRRMGHSSHYPAKTLCDICLKGKQTRSVFHKLPEEKKSRRILEVVSSDVAGPISPPTNEGMKYYVTFIDHYSHFTHCYLMKTKNEVFEKFKEYESLVTAQFETKISRFRCDNGGEYSSSEFKSFCKAKGIQLEYNIPRNPEQNGICERFNRTLMNMVRCLLLETDIEKEFWGEAARAATYVINRTETRALTKGKTPAEVWLKRKPDLNNIRIFGSKAFVHVPKEERGKLDERSRQMIMIGYTVNGYRLWDTEHKKLITARSVIFDENCKRNVRIEIPAEIPSNNEVNGDENESKLDEPEELNEINQNQQERMDYKRSIREKKIPIRFLDYETNLMAALSTGCLSSEIPTSYEEAAKTGWTDAINEEIKNLNESETWEFSPPPTDKSVIECKWIFRKKNIQGQEIKKARLVARGFQQDPILEEDVYAPVARMMTLRVLLSIAAEEDLLINQLDVKAAFLKSDLKEPVFLKPPEGVSDCPPGYVCKLKRALYGLRQSPKCWYDCLNEHLLAMNLKRSKVDPCLYFNNTTFLLIWVDDIILLSRCSSNLIEIKCKLMQELEIRDLSNVNKITFLGLEIEKKHDCIIISQKELIKKVINHFNMNQCKPAQIPIQHKLNLKTTEHKNFKLPYKELIGSLMYIMLGTRPDLCYSVNYFSQFQNCYNENHWQHLKHVLRYLQETKNFGLKFVKIKQYLNVSAFVDADFANDENDRKSITGFLIKLGGNAIFWKSKKQGIVTLSSCEAEYVALSHCVTECIYLSQLLKDLIENDVYPMIIYEDNQACIKIATTLENKRSKHIDVRHHFIRDCVKDKRIELRYISTNEQQADLLTKALSVTKFKYLRNLLNVLNV